MNTQLQAINFKDNGDFVSGVSEFYKETFFITYRGNILALKYNFSARPGAEYFGLTVIHGWDLGTETIPESELEAFYLPLAEAATESAIESIKKEVKPLISDFKEAYDHYHSDGSSMDFEELRHRYSEMEDRAVELVESSGLGWDGMRTKEETPEDVYYADPEILDALITPDMSDMEIETAAIEETFVNWMLFHPSEIARVLFNHRDYLMNQAS